MSTSYLDTGKPKISLRFILLSFVIGMAAGTTGDFMHVVTKTTGYPPHGPFPYLPFPGVLMPVWVPIEFGLAVVLMAVNLKLFSPMYRPRMAGNERLAIAAPMFFTLIYALTGIIKAGTGGLQDVWVALTAIALWYFADRTFLGAAFALIIAFIGTGFEIFLTSAGGFFYYAGNQNLFGVPSWLPWLYMCASICVGLLVRHID